MPIKLKKYNILTGVDNPDEGYMVLGFNLDGDLVYKDSDGKYGYIVDPNATTGYFEKLDVDDYLTVGTRLTSGVTEYGRYSITQGNSVEGSGNTSYGQGNTVSAKNNWSTARGKYTIASNDYAYICGLGYSNSNKLVSNGANSFVHSYADTSNPSGTLADYSVIIGGKNQYIASSADNSVIIGGEGNTITGVNTAIIASSGVTDDGSGNAVYLPRLVLQYGSHTNVTPGTIEWSYDSATHHDHFRCYRLGVWTNMDTNSDTGVTSISSALSSEISTRISNDIPLSLALSTEISTRTSADIPISSALSTEITNSASADSSLSSAIVSNNNVFALSISTETSNRSSTDLVLSTSIINGDNTISSNISLERSNRISGDLSLSNAISTEGSIRLSADVSLTTAIAFGDNTLQSSIGSETSTRSNADIALSNAISSETGTRGAADIVISTNISSETITRTANDIPISNAISTEIYIRSSVDTSISTNIGSRTYTSGYILTPTGQNITGSLNELIAQFNYPMVTINIGTHGNTHPEYYNYNYGTGCVINGRLIFNGIVERADDALPSNTWITMFNHPFFSPYLLGVTPVFEFCATGLGYGFVRPIRVSTLGLVEFYNAIQHENGIEWWYTLNYVVDPSQWTPA